MEPEVIVCPSESYGVFRILRNAAAIVGVAYLLKITLKELITLWRGFRTFFLTRWSLFRVDLKKYGQWAVVTGASEGIGKIYALELARLGLNVVIMSRSEDKLQLVASEIREKYGRKVYVVPVDFCHGQDIYPNIAEVLRDLDIGILINNVGLSYEYPEYFLQVSKERLRNIIELNCQTTVQMTHLILPKMLKKKRGIIVNVSSMASNIPCPLLAVYAASKVFINYFSDALRHEYGSEGIIIQTTIPNIVTTAMSKARRATYFSPTPLTYSRAAVATIGLQNTSCGYWPHALQGYVLSLLPQSWYVRIGFLSMSKARRTLLSRRARAQQEHGVENPLIY